jgi:hypothetical protein
MPAHPFVQGHCGLIFWPIRLPAGVDDNAPIAINFDPRHAHAGAEGTPYGTLHVGLFECGGARDH